MPSATPDVAGKGGKLSIARLVSAVLFAASCAASLPALAQPVDVAATLANLESADRDQRLVEGARRERELNLYTSLVTEDLTAIAAAFEKKYAVKVKFWRASSEKVVQRVITEARGNRFDVDVIETNGPELEQLVRERMLLQVKSPRFADLVPQAVMPHREWVGTRLNVFVQAYNTSQVAKADLPKRYSDLLDPKWKGRLTIEAEDSDWFATVVKDLGEEQGLKLFRNLSERNGLSVRKGHSLLAGLVASGEVPFALTVYSHNAEKLKQRGAPIDWYAITPAIARANGVAVTRRPAHPHAALLFYDFLLSEEGQRILEKGNYVPTSRKLNNPVTATPFKFVDPAIVLDESAKWDRLYNEIVVNRAR
jgi:iron(III) transport system substrate-binding protein